MVGMFKVLLSSLLLATFTAAQTLFGIDTPSSTVWWVDQGQNTMSWECHAVPTISNFTVIINNTNQAVLPGNLAIIAQLDNADCSYALQINQTVATGYTLVFADPFNNTNVYAASQQFEIKALGAAYPATSAVAANGTATSTVSSSPTARSKSSALGAHNPSSVGLAGLMGLLVAAVLGA